MTNRHVTAAQAAPRGVKVILALLLACVALAGLLFLAVAAYLGTPGGARQAGRLLSNLSPCPLTVEKLKIRPWSLAVEGISVASPPSWGTGNILTIRRLEMVPDILALVTGKRRLRSIEIHGASLVLARNRGGTWNVAEVLRGLPSRKPSTAETFIGRLTLRDCSVTVENHRFQRLDATLSRLSTTGALASRIEITATPPGSDPFRIAGEVTPGRDPGFQLTLAAPQLPLAMVTDLSPKAATLLRDNGSFGISLDARLANGVLSLAGAIPFKAELKAPGGGNLPLDGSLTFAGRYDQNGDQGVLQRCSLAVRDLLQLDVRGEVAGVRGRGQYRATASMTELNLARYWPLAPESLRDRFSVGGVLSLSNLRLEGDRRSGITAGGALLQLRQGTLKDGKGPLLTGLSARVVALRKQGAWHLDGHLSQEDREPGLAITDLRATLAARLPDDRKHGTLRLSPVTGTLEGAPLTGQLLYQPGDGVPLSGRLKLVAIPLATLNRFLSPTGPRFSAGTASLDMEASGQDHRHLSAQLDLRLEKPGGALQEKEFTAKAMSTQARLVVSDGTPSLTGFARLQEGSFGGKSAAVSLTYAFSDQTLRLAKVEGSVAGTSFRMEAFTAPLRSPSVTAGIKRLPLLATFQGLTLQQGDLAAVDMSGSLEGLSVTAEGKRWLEGTVQLKAPTISLGGRQVAAVTGRLLLAPGEGTLQLTGTAFGGQVSVTATGDPLATDHRASFSLDLNGLQGSALTAALGQRLPVGIGRGAISASSSGIISPSTGLRCRFDITATDLALLRERKTLISRCSMVAHGTVDGQRISLEEGKIALGEGITARLTAEMSAVASPSRKGSLRVLLPPTGVSALLDSLANALPPALQEASADGTLGLTGELRIDGQSLSLDGETELAKVMLEFPAQKLNITGVNGRLPFSLARPSPQPTAMADPLPLQRQAYPALLASFSAQGKGTSLKLERIRLGDLELVDTEMTLAARDGISSITSLRSRFFGGDLFARGHFRYGAPLEYGADLLLHDLSLQQLCDALPAIRGYLSGRVDGVVGLFSEKAPQGGLAGTVEVWTRPGDGEPMLISREFLQKLAGKNLKGLFFRADRPYDRGEVSAFLEGGYLTFDRLDISHTNLLGVRDLSVTVVPVQNRIALSHLLQSIRDAAARGKGKGSEEGSKPLSPEPELLWLQ